MIIYSYRTFPAVYVLFKNVFCFQLIGEKHKTWKLVARNKCGKGFAGKTTSTGWNKAAHIGQPTGGSQALITNLNKATACN